MKVLSLVQPWASLVTMGIKKIETRSWQTAYRGELLIHASTTKKGGALCARPPFPTYIESFAQLPFGAIIGSVRLKNIVPIESLKLSDELLATLTLEEKAFGDYKKRYAWLLENPVPFHHPITIKGSLGLWNFFPE